MLVCGKKGTRSSCAASLMMQVLRYARAPHLPRPPAQNAAERREARALDVAFRAPFLAHRVDEVHS